MGIDRPLQNDREPAYTRALTLQMNALANTRMKYARIYMHNTSQPLARCPPFVRAYRQKYRNVRVARTLSEEKKERDGATRRNDERRLEGGEERPRTRREDLTESARRSN